MEKAAKGAMGQYLTLPIRSEFHLMNSPDLSEYGGKLATATSLLEFAAAPRNGCQDYVF